jgi:hypothetical protein
MPVSSNAKPKTLPSPWEQFLRDFGALLPEPIELHCLGGFVVCFFYGFPRSTGDIDFYTAVPAYLNLIGIAGEGTPLAKKYNIHLHHTPVMSIPDDYATRLTEMFPGQFKGIRLLALDPYDFLSKLECNTETDRDDADYLFKAEQLDAQILRDRFKKELRPYLARQDWHDSTLELWIDIFEAN